MSQNRWSILCLCSQFKWEEGLRPLTTAEFRNLSALLKQWGKSVGDLFQTSFHELCSMGVPQERALRILALLDRLPVIETLVGSYSSMGIHALTTEEPTYFPTLKATLGGNSPPVLCCVGNHSLAEKPVVGIVGARAISPTDGEFTRRVAGKIIAQGYGVVSGGADGTDSIGEEEALRQGGYVVEFPAVPLLRRMKKESLSEALREGRLLIATPVAPNSGFSAGLATSRNRMIYAHSQATVVIRATACKGGTWSGATDALKRSLCPLLCWDQPYEGNQNLLQNGALPIEENWDGSLPYNGQKPLPPEFGEKDLPDQCSLFRYLP